MPRESTYCLGSSDRELARLELQHEVWREITDDLLGRLELSPGGRVLDAGAGPGFLTADLRGRVGERGQVVALDESERWVAHLERRAEAEGWSNVRVVRGRIEDAELDPGRADAAILRWVLGFLPDPSVVLARIARALRPGGELLVMDYNHEGVSLFPESEGFRAVIAATRKLYASRGGDTWIMGRIHDLFRGAGLEPVLLRPYVIAGGPPSPAFRWADAFFPLHVDGMVEEGVLSSSDRERFLSEWAERKADPGALFFSPIVAGAIARKPS